MLLDNVREELKSDAVFSALVKKGKEPFSSFMDGQFDEIIYRLLPLNVKLVCYENNLFKFWIGNYGVLSIQVKPTDKTSLRVSARTISLFEQTIYFTDLFVNVKSDERGFAIYQDVTSCSYTEETASKVEKVIIFRLDNDEASGHISWEQRFKDGGKDDAALLFSSAKLVLDESMASLGGDKNARFGGRPAFPDVRAL